MKVSILEKFPDFGYLFELGRLNLNFQDQMPDLIQEKIHEIEKDYHLSSEEYLDYVRYIMFKFAEYNIPIQESDIQLVKRGYHFSGEHRFLVRNQDSIEGIRVSLKKFGANTDDVIWVPSIVDSHQLFKKMNKENKKVKKGINNGIEIKIALIVSAIFIIGLIVLLSEHV